MSNIYNYKDDMLIASFNDVDPKLGIVTGYFSRFNNVDADGDIMIPGAFAKTITEQGPGSSQPRIKHLLNHDPSQPLGKLLSLKEDATGLAYESQIGGHELGEDFIKMVESGLITEHSIGFKIVKRNQIQSYEQYQSNPAGGMFEITEVKLYEGSSLTAWGANPLTPITSLKSQNNIDLFVAKMNAIEKFCRNSNATDETIEMLLNYNKQLAQFIVDNRKATEPVKATQPDVSGWIREYKQSLIQKP